MLNENLAKIRKERGLTQEALAIKLNVVRQTISKWENGTAVPDADMLCKIADALETSVADLLGQPHQDTETDAASIAKSLAEINEQLAIRNRRSGRIWKIVCGIMIGLLMLIMMTLVLNLGVKTSVSDEITTNVVDSANAAIGATVKLDENGVPLFSQINSRNEHALREFLSSVNLSDEQLIEAWGEPTRQEDNAISWPIDEDHVITVYFNEAYFAYDCGIEEK